MSGSVGLTDLTWMPLDDLKVKDMVDSEVLSNLSNSESLCWNSSFKLPMSLSESSLVKFFLFIYLFIYFFIYLFIYLFIYFFIYLFIYLFICFIYLFIYYIVFKYDFEKN